MVKEGSIVASYSGTGAVTAPSAPSLPTVAPMARWEQVSSLAGEISSSAVQELLDCLSDHDPLVSWLAGVALARTAARLQRRARLGMPVWNGQNRELTFSRLFALLCGGLEDADPQRRAATADALALWGYEPAVSSLVRATRDSQPLVRASAATALGHIGDKSAVAPLLSALSDRSIWVRRAAADALGAIGDPRGVAALEQTLADSQPLVRASAVRALGHIHTARARKALGRCAQDGDSTTRWYSARGLARIGDVGSVPILEGLKEDDATLFGQSTSDLATAAIEAIEKRERGLWKRLRRTFYTIRRRFQEKSQARNAGSHGTKLE